jgi:flagellar secretion chaperone FliS
MDHNEIAGVYRQISTRGSHPVALVVKMYEAVLEDFRRAMIAVNAGDIQGRTASLNHALQVIAELQSVLNHELGGEVSRRLDGFYNVTRSLIIEANIHSNPLHVQRLIDLYMPLRQAWIQVEHEATTGKLPASVPSQQGASQTPSASNPSGTATSETPQSQWSA